ncbi:ATP-dependent DNA helicase-like protein recQ [Tricladium varicosporioides]|nr:ATP-dependent DNA helicase-like protein recQ [Hymenoscyphus varicosporioides]
MDGIKEEDYGLSSGDDDDITALANNFDSNTRKRKAIDQNHQPAKRLITNSQALNLATKALKEIFGMSAFRLKQEQVVERLLEGKSATVVFPTGGGKSLCFQIPALVFSELDKVEKSRGDSESGITLVVSPLIALMKDQVDSLTRRGIKAATFDSTKTREQYLQTCEMLRNGELKLLYCAPERLNNEAFVEQMKHVRGGVRLLVVDESHCISEWGHAFRPDYLKIARFCQEIEAERVICLTATATPKVARDICQAFDIDEAGLFRTSTYRSNLKLIAESGKTKKALRPRLFEFLKANLGPTIIYVTLQKHTEELAATLRANGFKARAFHAGMETSVKMKLQDEFMRVNDLIMVATIAFGMGIDKANIRNIIHFNIPSSLESYSQEIGRAGRDGKISNCVFYVCGEDLHLREMFARGDLPSRNSVRAVVADIFDIETLKLCVGGEIKRNLNQQQRDFDIRSTSLLNIYTQLEITHNLIRATTPIYTKYTYKVTGQYASKIDSDKTQAGQAVKRYSKKASTLWHIDVDLAASSCGIPRIEIVKKLSDLDQNKLIELKSAGVLNVFKVTQALPKACEDIEKLANAIYSVMEQHEQEALARADQMLQLISGSSCFSRALAQHFGDDLPDGKTECGHCTWCLTHVAVVQETPPPVPWNEQAFKAILDKVPPRDDARLLAKIAFGIASPRVTALKMSRDPAFGSMEDHQFMDLLREFTSVCNKANHVG